MKIRPKEIPIFLNGGVPQWYLDRYGNRTSLINWNKQLDYSHSNQNLNNNGHRNAGTLQTAYNKNMSYIGTPSAVASDIQSFYNSDGKNMSAKDFETFYNSQADIIRSHWALDQTYGKPTAGDHNRLYRRMFLSRSNQALNPSLNEIYNIGYLDNLENIEGSSTWLRRMDLYENENESDTNRIHEITLKDGSKAKYYKTSNGNIKLLSTDSLNGAPSQVNPNTIGAAPPNPTRSLEELQSAKPQLKQQDGSVGVSQFNEPESKWKIFGDRLKNAAPDIIEALRLAGNLHNNNRVYDAVLKGIRPNLLQTYNTYRQVVGDEATKQAYYRRGIAGQTKAGLAFTSDADRQMAYLMEAKRAADELKAQGDLADNAEIRRTSDESNQHAWGNVQRATEVANRNLIEMNNANAAKWNLKALKYSADWTNWDNYLMGIQNRWQQKKEEDKAFLRQLAALSVLNDYLNDPQLNSLELKRQEIYNQLEVATDSATKESLRLKILLKNREISTRKLELDEQALRKAYGVLVAKSGSKIEYKYKRDGDKYLYKTSRDVVEHFRAMSRMSDESRLKSRTRPIKLSSHPKGNTRKYLLGGVAPFTIFRPLGIGGESVIGSQTTSSGSSKSSNSSSSGKDDASKNKLDLVKELFKSLKGLPVDVNMAYKDIYSLFEKSKLFGEELSTDDIAGIYLNSMRAVSLLLYGQEAYEKAKALATSNEALNEYAVTSDGSYVVSDKDGNLSYKKNLKEIEESGLVPITNLQLINMRAYSPNMVGLRGDTIIENVIGNGMGVNKIGDQIKALAGKIGTSESKLDGISQVESNKVKQGLQILAGAPDGYYKITTENKTQQAQVNAALSYIENMLSPSQRAILNAHGGTKPLIQAFLTSQLSATENISISPLTGKAAADKDKDSLDKVSSNPLLAMLREIGGNPINYSLVTRDSNTRISVNGTAYPSLPKVDQDMSISKMLSTSGIDGIITSRRGITFGDLQIKPEDLNHIMYSIDGGGTIVTLPCKIVNGVKLVNLDIRESYEKAELRALLVSQDRHSPEFIKALGEELKKEHLDSLLDSNGLPNKNMFALFLLVEGYTTDRIDFKRDSLYVEKVKNPDSSLESRMSLALSTDKKKLDYSIDIDDHWGWFEGTWDDIYRGTIFIPLNNNPNAAINSWGGSVNVGLSTELEELYQNANKSTKFNNNNSL